MRKPASVFARVGFLALAVGCSSIRNKRITEQNKDKVWDQIKNSKDLTVEEVQLLQGYMIRRGLQRVMNGRAPTLPVGKTIGEIIDEQRAYVGSMEKERQEEEARAKRLAAEEAAKEAAMRRVLTLTLFNLSNQSSSLGYDYSLAKFAYQNNSDKDIRAFEGTLAFSDVLGNKLADVDIKVLTPLKAGQKGTKAENLYYMVYTGLSEKKFEDLKTEWKPQKIIFSDGSQMGVAGGAQ